MKVRSFWRLIVPELSVSHFTSVGLGRNGLGRLGRPSPFRPSPTEVQSGRTPEKCVLFAFFENIFLGALLAKNHTEAQ